MVGVSLCYAIALCQRLFLFDLWGRSLTDWSVVYEIFFEGVFAC